MLDILSGMGVAAIALSLVGGDLTGHAVITKRLSKKAVSAANYNLRGTTAPLADPDVASEFDRMVVILEGANAAAKAPETLTIEQRNGRFEPDLLVAPVGSTVLFPNLDPIFHNVFSLSHAQSFDLGFYPKGQSRAVKFHREGIVQVYCHIHANMYAAIVITKSPWYTKPGPDGGFAWSNLPGGHYKLTVWHTVAGSFKGEADVPESGSAEVTIRVPIDTGDKR
jgi:plastocyanin